MLWCVSWLPISIHDKPREVGNQAALVREDTSQGLALRLLPRTSVRGEGEGDEDGRETGSEQRDMG